MARGCCLLEFLRRDATFSESLRASAAGRNPLIPSTPTDQPSPSSPLPPLPPAPRLPGPLPPADTEALAAYLGGFRVAVDVMDQARQAILASAVVRACVRASRYLYLGSRGQGLCRSLGGRTTITTTHHQSTLPTG